MTTADSPGCRLHVLAAAGDLAAIPQLRNSYVRRLARLAWTHRKDLIALAARLIDGHTDSPPRLGPEHLFSRLFAVVASSLGIRSPWAGIELEQAVNDTPTGRRPSGRCRAPVGASRSGSS